MEKKEQKTFTRLIDKQYSPLVIRKITYFGFPIYVGIITDDDLTDFDEVIVKFMTDNKEEGWVNDLQKIRNLAGALVDHIVAGYKHTEGVAVIFSVDKTFISSLYGDFMTHTACRIELFSLLTMSTGV